MEAGNKDISLILKALNFAADKHRCQRRQDNKTPYINHPIQVAELLANGGINDSITIAAGMLHDTLEDTETTPEELRQLFGEEIANIVLEVTDGKGKSKEERNNGQVENAPHLSLRAQQIKLADKLHNISDISPSSPPGWTLSRKRNYLDWAQRVVERLRGCNRKLEACFEEVLLSVSLKNS